MSNKATGMEKGEYSGEAGGSAVDGRKSSKYKTIKKAVSVLT
jgi:hypothetical protein